MRVLQMPIVPLSYGFKAVKSSNTATSRPLRQVRARCLPAWSPMLQAGLEQHGVEWATRPLMVLHGKRFATPTGPLVLLQVKRSCLPRPTMLVRMLAMPTVPARSLCMFPAGPDRTVISRVLDLPQPAALVELPAYPPLVQRADQLDFNERCLTVMCRSM